MFSKQTYINRRQALKKKCNKGLLLFPGNTDVPFNYPANIYPFRQDSSFLYYFGVNNPGYTGIIDLDSGDEILFGHEVTIDDIIWSGNLPSLAETAAEYGIGKTMSSDKLAEYLGEAVKKGKEIHFLPPYRGETKFFLSETLGIPYKKLKEKASVQLVKAVAEMRSVKEEQEIKEIEKALDVAYLMHTAAMHKAKAGLKEREIYGYVEGIALAHGYGVSFPVIMTKNGHILHNHHHENTLKDGDLMVTDAGAETALRYTSDITRTIPVSGKFSQKQKDIYEIVLKANTEVSKNIKPGVKYKDMHLLASEIVAQGLKDLGIMKGNPRDAAEMGASALFMPHGLGHMMGMDVHDMEGLGEDYIGYDEKVKRSDIFGLAFLRLARELKQGFVLTNEPGTYFIPELIDLWKREGKHTDFINYDKLEAYRDFGGIRIEDDIIVTETGAKVLGKPIPKTVAEIEAEMQKSE